jgi:hypothetical protein
MPIETRTILIAAAITALVLIVLIWIVWKFFFRFFKYFAIALIATVAGISVYYFQTRTFRNPAIGKHAYSTESGKYLGVIEGQGEETRRGEVWIVRPPGRDTLTYSKSRVTIKDNREIDKEPKAAPTPNPSASPKRQQGKAKKAVSEKKP